MTRDLEPPWLFVLLAAATCLLAAPAAQCQYIDDLVPDCKLATPETICGNSDDRVTVTGFQFNDGKYYAKVCAEANRTGSQAMYAVVNSFYEYVYDISTILPYTSEGCGVFTDYLLNSINSYQYICPKSTTPSLLPARMEMLSQLRKSDNYTFLYCDGDFVPGQFNNRSSTARDSIVTQQRNQTNSCNGFTDLSASGTGWNEWFDGSDYARRALDLGLSTVVDGIKSKQWQAACLALNGSLVPQANDVFKGDLVAEQLKVLMRGGVPKEQKSTTRAQHRAFDDASGAVQQLTLFSDSICTYNEVGKCLTQVRYYCQPNATSVQNSGSSIFWEIPNGCFFQMRVKNAGPSNSSADPLFSTGEGEPRSNSNLLENSQHSLDWEEQNSVFFTNNADGDFTQLSLLPVGAQYKLCNNESLATAVPFYNKLFGVSNLQVVAKNERLCVLGNATTISGSCVADLDAGGSVLQLSENVCLNSTDASVCDDNSQVIVLGAHFNAPRYDCGIDEVNCAVTFNAEFFNQTCYTWYVSGGDLGTYEVVNSTDIRDYYSINETSDSDLHLAYLASESDYLGFGDGILCGPQSDMMAAAAKCYSRCYYNLTANVFDNLPCDVEITAFGATFDGAVCSQIFKKYANVRNQLGVPAEHTIDGLLGTLGSGAFGINNRNVYNLGDIQNVNTSIVTGSVVRGNALLPNKYQGGYCYVPLAALSGYKASLEGYEVNIPISQGITQLQTEPSTAQLAETLEASIQRLQNYAQQQTPPVDLATILLTITSCLGALTGIKILELYFLFHGLQNVIKSQRVYRTAKAPLVVITTVVLTAFAIAPAVAMFIQDRQARNTHYTTTFGAYVQNDLYSSDLSTLSVASTSVTYVQYTPYATAVDVVFYTIIALSSLWWLYATIRILATQSPQKP